MMLCEQLYPCEQGEAQMTEPEPLMFADRDEWRAWLEKNHDKSDGIWLAYYKKDTGKHSVHI